MGTCEACDGRGLIPRAHEQHRRGNTGTPCPECRNSRRIPVLRIAGTVPEVLLSAITGPGSLAKIDSHGPAGAAVPFTTDVRVA